MNSIYSYLGQLVANAAITAAFLGVLGWFFKEAISKWMTAKLTEKSQQRISTLENTLAQKSAEISDVRKFIVSQAVSRQDRLVEKQIAATEVVWASVCEYNRQSFAAEILKSLNIYEVDKRLSDQGVADFTAAISSFSGVNDLLGDTNQRERTKKINDAAQASRPFISPLAWSLYKAHSALVMYAVSVIHAWKSSLSIELLDADRLVKSLCAALPHQSDFLEKHGVSGAFYMLDELTEAILAELKRFLQEGNSSQHDLDLAAALLKGSNDVIRDLQSTDGHQ